MSDVQRRGLPRTPGGQPWPLTGTAARRGPSQAEVPPVALAPPPRALTARTVSAHRATLPLGPLRRGLPRVPGGEPWPPATESAVETEPAVGPARAAPAVRPRGRGAIARWIAYVGGATVAVAVAVLTARGLLQLPAAQSFVARYPGQYALPAGAPVGLPRWLGWQHFFNFFLMVAIIRSGLQVRRERKPAAYWSPRRNAARKISLALWFHQGLDLLWLLNGAVYVVLLFSTGQWMRIVPTSWEVFPNALSAALQYAALDWPTEHGWVNYNSLQQLAYFTTVFVAAPIATVSGLRMSGLWPSAAVRLSRALPVEAARAVHLPTMAYFVAFIVAHVALVFSTGARRNLNHMFAGQDVVSWVGAGIFALAVAVTAAALAVARPVFIAPVASLFGRVSNR